MSQNTMTTVAGGGTNSTVANRAVIPAPASVVADRLGNVYVSVPALGRVYKADPAGNLAVVAGGGSGGDGGPATSASLGYPAALAVDSDANLYVADSYRVRRVDATTGIITTVAGNGNPGFSGDGGQATDATLSWLPDFGHLAVDAAGNLFIADTGNSRVRRVDGATGVISTFAGDGTMGFDGDGGPAIHAKLSYRFSVTADTKGNLLIADADNGRIRRVDADTGIITTAAGCGCGDMYPWDVAVDGVGNLFIPDLYAGRVLRVDAATGTTATVAGGTGITGWVGDGGAATSAGLDWPRGIALDSSGNVFILDFYDNRIRRVDAATSIITTAIGGGSAGDGGPATSAFLLSPWGVAADVSGNFFVADSVNNRVRRVDANTGTLTTAAGNGAVLTSNNGASPAISGDGGPAVSATLVTPNGLALDSSGNLLVAGGCLIRRVDAATSIITTVAGNRMSCGSDGDGGPATSAYLSYERLAVAVDEAGNIYIADTSNARIRRVDAGGIITTVAGNGVPGFGGDGGAATDANLLWPEGVAADGAGNLFIADTANCRIRRVDAETGIISTYAGNGGCYFAGDGGPAVSAATPWPTAVAVDSAGNVFIADQSSPSRIRRIDTNTGVIATIAGGGSWETVDTTVPATSTGIGNPYGIALDNRGHLFISDYDGGRIRRVDLAPMVTFSAAALSFADQATGTTSAPQTVTLTNSGGANLTINSIDLTGQFVQTNDCPVLPATLHPGSVCAITVTFKPLIGATLSGAITISDDAFGAPHSIQLSGTGFGPPVDVTPPSTVASLSPSANGSGWNNSDVAVVLNATDNSGGAGVKQIAYSASGAETIGSTTVNGGSAVVPIAAEGVTTVSYLATDMADNAETAKSITVRVDKTPPAINILQPSETLLLNQQLTASYSCTDSLSGVRTCSGTVANGALLNTATVGAGTFSVTASDQAGNTSSATNGYTVGYNICVLYNPNLAKQSGSTYPIKLQLCDVNGANVSSPGIVVTATGLAAVSNTAPGPLDDSGDANPDFNFRYDASLSGYIFNLKLSNYQTGTYNLLFKAGNDPTTHAAQFQVK